MKNKEKDFFSELDKKVIEELPMLIDVFVNTFTNLKKFQEDNSNKIKTHIINHNPEKI
jgi:hypothetical protein